jgi:hypothetical protein
MYKKITLLSALLYTLPQYAFDFKPWLEIKPSYFFFATSPMRKIYNHGGFEVQGSVSVPVLKYLDLYGSVGYRKASGHALNGGAKTTLSVIPVDFGLKPIFKFCDRFYYFFAIGPRYFHFNQRNDSPYVDCKVSGNGVGLFLNTGFNVLLADHFSLGIFGEYSYEQKKICPKKPNVFSSACAQLSGCAFGVSVGYAF